MLGPPQEERPRGDHFPSDRYTTITGIQPVKLIAYAIDSLLTFKAAGLDGIIPIIPLKLKELIVLMVKKSAIPVSNYLKPEEGVKESRWCFYQNR